MKIFLSIIINIRPIKIHTPTIYAGRFNGNAGTGYTVLNIANPINIIAIAGIIKSAIIWNSFSLLVYTGRLNVAIACCNMNAIDAAPSMTSAPINGPNINPEISAIINEKTAVVSIAL